MTHTDKQKLKRISFTMHPKYISMLSTLAENDSGATMSHEIRRLIEHEWNKQNEKQKV